MNEHGDSEVTGVELSGRPKPVLVVMGVSGCGKSTLASALAARLDVPYVDADDYHPASNVEKMKRGEPLTDADRADWLAKLRSVLDGAQSKGSGAALACSALKEAYRDQLGVPAPGRYLVYIHIDRETAQRRVARRASHFMPASLVESQFETLQAPSNAILVEATWPLSQSVRFVCVAVRERHAAR